MTRRLLRPFTLSGLAFALTIMAGWLLYDGNIWGAIIAGNAAGGCWVTLWLDRGERRK